jgi:hypothetical protein
MAKKDVNSLKYGFNWKVLKGMVHVNKGVVKLSLTPEAWDLLPEDGQEEYGPRALEAADVLNRKFEEMCSRDATVGEMTETMHNLMDEYSDVGAIDTEPRVTLQALIYKVYRLEERGV